MIRVVHTLLLAVLLATSAAAEPFQVRGGQGRPLSLTLREVPVSEVFQMLSRTEHVNVVLGPGVSGSVSVNLYEVSLDQAIRSIAEAAGFVAERRRGSYMILKREDAGQESADGNTVIRTFKVQYSDPEAVSEILSKYLSRYGDVTLMLERGLLVVEDRPDFVERIAELLGELDREPQQILIDAKILEVTLDETETWGIDWSKAFTLDDGGGSFGVKGLASRTAPGFFADLLNSNIEVTLDALDELGRVRTLSTPRLLALEHQEAEVVIGDRLGFRVTTTINEVTTESVEFLESGVILKFTASVDRQGRIVLDVHPEVSTGTISDGLPSQTTTEVTTRLITQDGEKVFIGGLIKDRSTHDRRGVPYLMDIPVLGWLFTRREKIDVMTETVVLITTHLVGGRTEEITRQPAKRIEQVGDDLQADRERLNDYFDAREPRPDAGAPAPAATP